MRAEIKQKIINSNANSIDLSELHIKDTEIKEVAHEIKTKKPGVRNIILEKNNIGDAGAVTLGKEFASLSQLSFIDVQFNQIGKAGALAIFALKLTHSNLTIAMHGNKVTDVTEMKAIEDAAVSRTSLKK